MRYKQYLTEKRKNNVIVVDVQPIYQNSIHFDMQEFIEFLDQQGKILYFFNGPDTVGGDSKEQILDWLINEGIPSPLYYKLKSKDTLWIDKGYGFLRSWMDMGADEGFIKQAIRFMMSKRENDSRDIEPEVWMDKFPNDYDRKFDDDPIYLPDIPINTLKTWSGSYMLGGGRNECLKEMQILMSIFNIKYKLVRKFTF